MRGSTIGLLRFSEEDARDIRVSPATDAGMLGNYPQEELLDSVNNTSAARLPIVEQNHVCRILGLQGQNC